MQTQHTSTRVPLAVVDKLEQGLCVCEGEDEGLQLVYTSMYIYIHPSVSALLVRLSAHPLPPALHPAQTQIHHHSSQVLQVLVPRSCHNFCSMPSCDSSNMAAESSHNSWAALFLLLCDPSLAPTPMPIDDPDTP